MKTRFIATMSVAIVLAVMLSVFNANLVEATEVKLVKNGGFEIWLRNYPIFWRVEEIVAKTTDAHSGRYAIIVGDFESFSRIFQYVVVTQRQSYVFSVWQKYSGYSEYTRIELLWLRADGSMIEPTDSLFVGAGADDPTTYEKSLRIHCFYPYQGSNTYVSFTFRLKAPAEAKQLVIYFVKPGWDVLCVDDCSLASIWSIKKQKLGFTIKSREKSFLI